MEVAVVHTGNGGGRWAEAVCACSRWPEFSPLGESASVTPAPTSQSEQIVSVWGTISLCCFKNGIQAAGEHGKRMNYDQLKQQCCNSSCWMQRKKFWIQNRMEKEGRRGKLRNSNAERKFGKENLGNRNVSQLESSILFSLCLSHIFQWCFQYLLEIFIFYYLVFVKII